MRLSFTFCFLTAVFCLTSINAFGQTVEYLSESGTSTTAENYFYKRVFKYKEPVAFPTFGTNVYTGVPVIGVNQTGHHSCSFTDYYRTGEVAVIGTILAVDITCTVRGGFNGQVVAYHKNGNIKRQEPWNFGKLHGTVIYYNESGSKTKREEYVEGKKVDAEKFVVSADNPFIGTWKYIEYSSMGYEMAGVRVPPVVKKSLTLMLNQNGVLNYTRTENFMDYKGALYWKYTPSNCTSGILEEYVGNDLAEKVNIKWINSNQFEFTVIFPQNSASLGNKMVFTREGQSAQKNLCSSNFDQLNYSGSVTTSNVTKGFKDSNFGTNISSEKANEEIKAGSTTTTYHAGGFKQSDFSSSSPEEAARAVIAIRNENASFLLGVWKFTDKLTKASMKLVISKDDNAEMIVTMNDSTEIGSFLWFYEKKSNSSGALKFYGKKEQIADIKWLNDNQFEYTITSSSLFDKSVGTKLIFTRQ